MTSVFDYFNAFLLEYRLLSFLSLTSYREAVNDKDGKTYSGGLFYSLEAGAIHWYGATDDQAGSLNLRGSATLGLSDREHLASWEPMTDDKLRLLAIELGLMGDVQNQLLMQPVISAIAVNPNGFAYHWNGDTDIHLSDVRTLAAGRDIFHYDPPDRKLWEKHSLSTADPGLYRMYSKEGVALLDSSAWSDIPDSLIEWSSRLVPPVSDPRTNPASTFTGETAEFVQRHFGVDVFNIDWKIANHTRFTNAKYGRTAPFDPRKAVVALRAAIATHSSATRTNPASPTFRQAQDPPHRLPGNVER